MSPKERWTHGMLKSQAVEREYEESHWEVASPAPGPASGQMMENVEHLHHKPVEDWPANMDRSVVRWGVY